LDQIGPLGPTIEVFGRPDGVVATCLRLGGRKRPGAPGGYVYTWPPDPAQVTSFFFANADPRVVEAFGRLFERDPCGTWGGSFVQTTSVSDPLYDGSITVPVLLIFGRQDAVFPPDTAEGQKAMFTGSHDLTLTYVENAGHMVMLQRSAPVFRAKVSGWLAQRGF
jgi:pimeloyl-ACP methyl ester carboxylesterase